MEQKGPHRKLTEVLSTEVPNYTHLIQEKEKVIPYNAVRIERC
jgi:hypothetical protein